MPDQHDDLAKARKYLERAEQEFGHLTFAVDRADTAARIGAGYAQLASVELADAALHMTLTAEQADHLRKWQAASEARPHDGEPVNLCETDADMARRVADKIIRKALDSDPSQQATRPEARRG